ncbi:MAG: winged helix-turn-helix domain-containing protein [Myxococcales bacterium]|nr:winged helix-turn-helix domain-containing protein [Myxococcales bacterium]
MLKPFDIVLLVALIGLDEKARVTFADIAGELGSNQPTVHRATGRLTTAGLLHRHRHGSLGPHDYSVDHRAMFEVLTYAVRYFMPVQLLAPARGLATAHAGPDLKDAIRASSPYVWPYLDGVEVDPSVDPLDPCVPHVAARHATFYRIMSLVEACRVGRIRERKLAEDMLRRLLIEERSTLLG